MHEEDIDSLDTGGFKYAKKQNGWSICDRLVAIVEKYLKID